MKQPRRYIFIILLFLIPTVSLWGASRRKTKQQVKKTKKSTPRKGNTAKSSSKRKLSKRAQKRMGQRAKAAYRIDALARARERREQEQERRERLYIGREIKAELVQGLRPSSVPILHRFLHSDSTLTRSEIRYLYLNTSSSDLAMGAIKERRIDSLISQEHFDEALSLTLSTLRLMPTHLGLLHRSSTLAHHLGKQELLARQVWKIAELMTCISYTGTGKDFDNAYQVLSRADAEAFETLWLDVSAEELKIRELYSGDQDGHRMVIISHTDPKSKKELHRYYKLPPKAINKKTTYNEYSVDRRNPNGRTGRDGTTTVKGARVDSSHSSPFGQAGHR